MLYDTFDIMQKNNIIYPDKKGSIRIDCPFCGHKKSFSIAQGGIKHGHWHCFSCEKGGGAMGFFMALTNSNLNLDYENDRKIINKEILEMLHLTEYQKIPTKVIPKIPPNNSISSTEKRDMVYRFILNMLPLSREHEKKLKKRGFKEDTIKNNLYRSVPPNTELIVKQLVQKGYDLKGVPGFFKAEEKWKLVPLSSGILIPIKNDKNHIKALNIRLDYDAQMKYIFISSANLKEGCGADGSCHIPGVLNKESEILIVEGLFKSDIAHQYLPKVSIIGILGSGNIKSLLEIVEKENIKCVKIALDMDQTTNRFVYRNLENLKNELSKRQIYYSILTWDAKFKGIDDYLTRTL